MRYSLAFVLAVSAVALAGCGGSSNSSSATTGAATTPASTTTAAATTITTTAANAAVTIRVVVKGGKPVGGIQRATVKKGEKVAIVVRSDVADEVHVHGYDLKRDVAAGGTVRIVFPATIVGEFEAELESRGLRIVDFTVK